MYSKNNDLGVRAELSFNQQGEICLTFFDPAYVRSDVIIFDRKDSSLHAVLHESAHFIGHVEKDMVLAVTGKDEINLAASHHSGRMLNLKTKLSVN